MANPQTPQVNAGQDQSANFAENAKRDDFKPHTPKTTSPQDMDHVQAVAEKLDADNLLKSSDSVEHDIGEGKSADELLQSTKDAELEQNEKAKKAALEAAGVNTDDESSATDATKTKYDDGDSDMHPNDKGTNPNDKGTKPTDKKPADKGTTPSKAAK